MPDDNDTLSAFIKVFADPSATAARAKQLEAAAKRYDDARAAHDKGAAESVKAQADANEVYRKASEERMAAKRDLANAEIAKREAQALLDKATAKEGELSTRAGAVADSEERLKKQLSELSLRERTVTEREENVAVRARDTENLRKSLDEKMEIIKHLAA